MKDHDFCEVVTREWGLSLEDVCETANPWLPVDEPVTNENCRFSEKGAEKILEIAKEAGVHKGDIDWVELLDSLKEKETEMFEWEKELKDVDFYVHCCIRSCVGLYWLSGGDSGGR